MWEKYVSILPCSYWEHTVVVSLLVCTMSVGENNIYSQKSFEISK